MDQPTCFVCKYYAFFFGGHTCTQIQKRLTLALALAIDCMNFHYDCWLCLASGSQEQGLRTPKAIWCNEALPHYSNWLMYRSGEFIKLLCFPWLSLGIPSTLPKELLSASRDSWYERASLKKYRPVNESIIKASSLNTPAPTVHGARI